MAVGETGNLSSGGGSAALEEAALCETPADYDGAASRAMIGHLLRPHLEALCLTPTEVLHGHRALRHIMDQRAAVETALARVAALQGKLPGQDLRARRAALQAAVEAVIQRVRTVEAALAALPKHIAASTAYSSGAIEGAAALGPSLARAVVVRDLSGLTTWVAKVDHLLGLVRQQADSAVHDAVDEVLGDLMLSAGAVRELVGARTTPGATLVRLVEMMQGRLSLDPGQPDRLGSLSQLFRQGRLPAARAAVLERVRRQLMGAEPLNPGQTDRDAEQLRALLAGLITADGVLGEGPMAVALTQRYARRFAQGGAQGLRRAVTAITESLAELPARVHYLAAVATIELASAVGDEIMACFDAMLANEALVDALVFRAADYSVVRRRLNESAAALAASALPESARGRLARRVERLVDEYLIAGTMLRNLEASEPAGARQALRLSELVAAGLVSDVGALVMIRRRLFELLRRPGFEAEFAGLRGGTGAALQRFQGVVDRLRQVPDDIAIIAVEAPARESSARGGVGADQVTMTLPRSLPASPAVTKPLSPEDVTMTMPRAKSRGAATPLPLPPVLPVRPQNTLYDNPTVAPTLAPTRPSVPVPPPTPVPVPPPAGDGRCPNCFVKIGGAESCPECHYADGVTPRSNAHLPPGTWLLGRYRAGRLLGQGGFGATYLGWDDRLRIKVAIKEYFPVSQVARTPGGTTLQPYTVEHREVFTKGIRKFLEEARTLAKLRDIREIVGVQDYFEDNNTAYLVMELLQGDTMKKYIADHGGRIDYRKALTILIPIMKALHSVHEQGMVHRDISPDNILMTSAGAKLLDFGAAREAAGEGGGGLTVILKPGFAPPEQYFSDSRQGPWTDVYALSASIYCAITGKPPSDSARRLQEETLVMPSAMGIAVPPQFETVLLTGLALRRQDRYPSMKALLAALSKAM